jgi:hypothetical protein
MSWGIGMDPLGLLPAGGGPLHDPPTVTLDAPTGTVSSGGPDVTITWTFGQEQGDAQEWYRVYAEVAAVIVYDTGWVAGAAASHVIDWDLEGLDPDAVVDLFVEVRGPEAIGTGTLARYERSGTASPTIDFGDPVATITAPLDASVHTDPDSVTVTWTFVDAGHTQGEYRIRLLSIATGAVLYTTGWVSSAVTTFEVPYLFSNNSQIRVEVQLKNDQGMRSS